MAAKTVDFVQIYYDDAQLAHLYPFAIPHKNLQLTPYFENSVIQDLVPQLDADLISICSWRLKEKRNGLRHLPDESLSLEKITSQDYDVAILTPRSSSHKALFMAAQWHSTWTPAFESLKGFLRTIGIKVPQELTYPIYENHFIATKQIYHEYIYNCLTPCINFIAGRDVFFADANYINRKKEPERNHIREILSKNFNRSDYPIAPFTLERLFSIWIENKNYKVIAL